MGLQKATIYDVPQTTSKVTCMFNPSEYTISKTNQFKATKDTKSDAAHIDLIQVGPRTLKLNLIFDTYEKGSDVNNETNALWSFMGRKDDGSDEPKQVEFK